MTCKRLAYKPNLSVVVITLMPRSWRRIIFNAFLLAEGSELTTKEMKNITMLTTCAPNINNDTLKTFKWVIA